MKNNFKTKQQKHKRSIHLRPDHSFFKCITVKIYTVIDIQTMFKDVKAIKKMLFLPWKAELFLILHRIITE